MHGEHDQVELARVHLVRRGRGKFARQLLRRDVEQWLPTLDRKRTTVPSRLISSAVGLVQTSDTRCPAISNLVPNNEP